MPEQDFDLYLSLLGKLLRLRPAQRAAIRDELQDHLEERTAELCGEGLTREAAVRRALDEFGDAAALADHFSRLTRLRTRRRIMRFTLAGSIVSAVALLVAFAFWPAPEGGPGVTPLVAAGPEASLALGAVEAAEDEATCLDPAKYLPEPLTQLTRPETLHISLNGLVKLLRDTYHVPTLLDEPRLLDLGINSDMPITIEAGLPLYLQLTRELSPHDVTWVWQDGVLRLTTIDYASTVAPTVTYSVGELLAHSSIDRIIHVILHATGDEVYGPWMEIHGTCGGINVVGETLVIRQTQRVHHEIQALLDALRTPSREVWCNEPSRNMELRRALRSERVAANFDNAPLSDVVAQLHQQTGLPLAMDEPRMQDLGVLPTSMVSLKLPEGPLEQVLTLLLEPLELDPVVDSGRIVLTTKDYNSTILSCVLFDVRDIVTTLEDGEQQLSDAIENGTGDESYGPWQEIHGVGGYLSFPLPGLLVVHQTARVQQEIHDLLVVQHAAAKDRSPVPPRETQSLETRYYRVPSAMAAGLLSAIRSNVAPGTWIVTRPDAARDDRQIGSIEETPVGSSWYQWANATEEPAKTVAEKLSKFDSVLIVTHRAEVQEDVTAFLNLLLFDNARAWKLDQSVPTGLIRTRARVPEPVAPAELWRTK